MNSRPVSIGTCDEEARLAALRRYGILDTSTEQAFDDLTRLAAQACGAPVAIISFVDQERQWFKSEIGLGVQQTSLDVSICAHAILQRDLFVVPDTLLDERFKHNPLVTGEPHLRFYAGALLATSDGHSIGTLCVLDHEPRQLDLGQREALQMLARQVMAQLELRRAKESAEAANRAKDRHLAFLAHELRGPLTPALMAAAAMAADASLPAEVRSDAGLIRRNIELATRLADDLLDANRIALGKLELRVEPTNVHETLRVGIGMCEADAAAKGVRIETDLSAGCCIADADAAKLTQVWTNLLTNAAKFSRAGGLITVRTLETAGDRLRVEVQDQGVGVDADMLPIMFNLYEQGDRAVTRDYAGLGLGLAICKGIVEAHGGAIIAASEGKGRGTKITVELPTTALRPAARPAGPAPQPKPCRDCGSFWWTITRTRCGSWLGCSRAWSTRSPPRRASAPRWPLPKQGSSTCSCPT